MKRKMIFAALLVGTLDIIGACLQHYLRTGKGPEGVLRFISSGFFGKVAFTGGTTYIWTGLLFHYIIAFAFTLLFVLLIKKFQLFQRNRFLTGFLYGVFVWIAMNLLILPLTQAPTLKRSITTDLQGIFILIVCMGLPLAYLCIPERNAAPKLAQA